MRRHPAVSLTSAALAVGCTEGTFRVVDQYRVVVTELALRSAPAARPKTVKAVLEQGEVVEKLGDASAPGWWRVRTVARAEPLEGFVNSRFLESAEAPPRRAPLMSRSVGS